MFFRRLPKMTEQIEALVASGEYEVFHFMHYTLDPKFLSTITLSAQLTSGMDKSNYPSVLQDFQRANYATAFLKQICESDYRYELDARHPTNTTAAFFCHPKFVNRPNRRIEVNRIYGFGPPYLQQQLAYEHSLDYVRSFMKNYENQRQFFFLQTNDAHDGSFASITYTDSAKAAFLSDLHRSGYLQDTLFFFSADHGATTRPQHPYLYSLRFSSLLSLSLSLPPSQ